MRLVGHPSSSPSSPYPTEAPYTPIRHTLPYPFSSFSVRQADSFSLMGRAERGVGSNDEDCGDDSRDGKKRSRDRALRGRREAAGVGRSDEGGDEDDADDEDEEEAGKQLPGIWSLALPRPQLPKHLPAMHLPRLAPPPYL